MPALTRIRSEILQDLARQIRFAGEKSARRHLMAAEALLATLDPETSYPEDFLVFRITGYRTDAASTPRIALGKDLIADFPALIERLCCVAAVGPQDVEGWLTLKDLTRRWGVSPKTVERLRKQGLVARRVLLTPARTRLAFDPRVVAKFESQHSARLSAARGYSRITREMEEAVIRRAARCRRRFKWSLARCADRLAVRFGRSPSAITAILRRNDAQARETGRPALFEIMSPARGRRGVVERASRRGVPVRLIAARLGMTRSAVERMARATRVAALREASEHAREVLERLDAPRTTPAASPMERTPSREWATLSDFLAAADQAAMSMLEERRLFSAYTLALAAALSQAAALRDRAGAAGIQRIRAAEDAFRLASVIKIELIQTQAGLLRRTIEAAAGTAITLFRPNEISRLLALMAGAISEAIDRSLPKRGSRLAGHANLALVRIAAHVSPTVPRPGQAQRAPIEPATVHLQDWRWFVHPWTIKFGLI